MPLMSGGLEGYKNALNRLREHGGLSPRFLEAGEKVLRSVLKHGHAPASVLWRSSGLNSRVFYSTLWKLVKMGFLVGVPVDGKVYFGFSDPPHDHLVCSFCRKVLDLERPSPQLRVQLPGWKITSDHLVAYGLCPECALIVGEIGSGPSYPAL